MKPFNLAEARIAERTYCQMHIGKRLRVIVFLLALMILMAGASIGCNWLIRGKAKVVASRLKAAEQRSQSIETRITYIRTQINQYRWQNQLCGNSKQWLSMVDAAINSLPDDVWLTKLETSPKNTSIILEGKSTSFDSLSVFIESLRRCPSFSDIRLGTTKASGTGKLEYIEFTMPIKVKSKVESPKGSAASAENTAAASKPILMARYCAE